MKLYFSVDIKEKLIMDKDLLIKTLQELFEEKRIEISFDTFNDWGGRGLRLSIKLDDKKVYEEDITQEYYED